MTGAILAGGQSRRMGFNKAFIKLNNETMIERAVKVFNGLFDEVFIVANDPILYEPLDIAVYTDIIKGAGSLGGVYTALVHAKSDHIFVSACDMPYLDPDTIKKNIATSMRGYDAAVPFIGGQYHPMHAVYSKRCVKVIKKMIDEGTLRITDLFVKIRTKRLDEKFFKSLPITLSVENINTREDLSRIEEK